MAAWAKMRPNLRSPEPVARTATVRLAHPECRRTDSRASPAARPEVAATAPPVHSAATASVAQASIRRRGTAVRARRAKSAIAPTLAGKPLRMRQRLAGLQLAAGWRGVADQAAAA